MSDQPIMENPNKENKPLRLKSKYVLPTNQFKNREFQPKEIFKTADLNTSSEQNVKGVPYYHGISRHSPRKLPRVHGCGGWRRSSHTTERRTRREEVPYVASWPTTPEPDSSRVFFLHRCVKLLSRGLHLLFGRGRPVEVASPENPPLAFNADPASAVEEARRIGEQGYYDIYQLHSSDELDYACGMWSWLRWQDEAAVREPFPPLPTAPVPRAAILTRRHLALRRLHQCGDVRRNTVGALRSGDVESKQKQSKTLKDVQSSWENLNAPEKSPVSKRLAVS